MQDTSDSAFPILPQFQQEDIPELAGQLMSAAIHLFARKGYTATSVREIVQTAGVTNPMLYYYFNSKEGLYVQLVTHLFDSLRIKVLDAVEEATTLEDKLYAVAWTHLDSAHDSPVVLQFVYSVLFGPRESRPEVDVYDLHVELIGHLTCILDRAIAEGKLEPPGDADALFLTQQLMGLLNNHMMRALTLTQTIDDPALQQEYVAEILSPGECRKLIDFFMAGAGGGRAVADRRGD